MAPKPEDPEPCSANGEDQLEQPSNKDAADQTYITLLECYDDLKNHKDTIQELEKKNMRLLQANLSMTRQNKRLKQKLFLDKQMAPHRFKQKFHRCLKTFFTSTQIDYFIGKKKISRWTDEDITNGIALRSISPKAYRYLRNKKSFPLPSMSTLDKWVKDINVEPGILNSALRLMKSKASYMSDGSKACILSFDEMSLSGKYAYDRGADTIYGPHASVQVVMVRGIIGSWKQPVYYQFDQKMTKDIIFSIIVSVEEAGFPVCATVCDMGGANRGLLTSLDISSEKTHFTNPFDVKRNIYVFLDVPHLLKLVRNNLINHGITTPEGLVSTPPIWEVIHRETGDFKIAFKVNESHLTVQGTDRQKVRPAAQLLSE